MGYLSVKQAAKQWQLSEELVEELCREGSLDGVVLEGHTYFIPDSSRPGFSNITAKPSSPEYQELIGRIDEMNAKLTEKSIDDALEEAFIVQFTYESGAIAGSSLSLEDTKKILAGEVVAGKSLKEHLQCVGQRDAFVRLKGLINKRVPLSENIIKELHAWLLLECPEDRGQYRKESLHVIGAYHQPPEADRVPAKMAKQVDKYNNPELHAIESAVLFLMKFEGIHPFMDGNGRLGRLLLNYMLMQQGYPAISIAPADKDKYYEAVDLFYRDHTAAPMVELISGYVERRLKECLA